MLIYKRAWIVVSTCLSVFLPLQSEACTCAVQPLAERYERASVVLVANVGERSDQFDESGNRTTEWSFDTDEVLKGNVNFDVLIPGGCGWGANIQLGV